jgi:hypothetical protein
MLAALFGALLALLSNKSKASSILDAVNSGITLRSMDSCSIFCSFLTAFVL